MARSVIRDLDLTQIDWNNPDIDLVLEHAKAKQDLHRGEMGKIRDEFEEQIRELEDRHKNEIRELKNGFEEERRGYEEEIRKLREQLAQERGQDPHAVDNMEPQNGYKKRSYNVRVPRISAA